MTNVGWAIIIGACVLLGWLSTLCVDLYRVYRKQSGHDE